MADIDRILAMIDDGLAAGPGTEPGYLGASFSDDCWRCTGPKGDGPSGVCESCRTELLAETPPPGIIPGLVPVDDDLLPPTVAELLAANPPVSYGRWCEWRDEIISAGRLLASGGLCTPTVGHYTFDVGPATITTYEIED